MLILTYKLFNFEEKCKVLGYKMDKKSFLKYIESSSFRRMLGDRILYGAITHEPRDQFVDEDNPRSPSLTTQSDFVLAKKNIASILIAIRVEDNGDVIGDLLVPDSEDGLYIQLMLGAESNIQVSMSIYSRIVHEEKKYYITRFSGVDFTTNPAWETQLIKKTVV